MKEKYESVLEDMTYPQSGHLVDEHFLDFVAAVKHACIKEGSVHLQKKQLVIVSLGCGENCYIEASQLAHAFPGQKILYFGFDIKDLKFNRELPLKRKVDTDSGMVNLNFNFHQCDTRDFDAISKSLGSRKADIVILRHPLFGIPQESGAYIYSEKCPMALTCRDVIPKISADHCTLIVTTYREVERDKAQKYLFAAGMIFIKFIYDKGAQVPLPEGESKRDKFCIVYPDYQPVLVEQNRKQYLESKKAACSTLKCIGFFAIAAVTTGLAYMVNQAREVRNFTSNI